MPAFLAVMGLIGDIAVAVAVTIGTITKVTQMVEKGIDARRDKITRGSTGS